MILDDLSQAPTYFALNPRIRRALEWMQATDLSCLAPGRYEIDGDVVVAGVADYATREESESRWEAHRQHIDIQCVLQGQELIGVAPLDTLVAEPYDAERDILFASGRGEFVSLTPGRFIVLFPHDGHMPGVHVHEPAHVRKMVVKIRC